MKRAPSRLMVFAVQSLLCVFFSFSFPASLQWAADTAKPSKDKGKNKEHHKFWNKTNISLQLLNIAAQAADLYSTERALKPGRVETNPILKSRPVRFGLKCGVVIPVSIFGSYRLHQEGRHNAERLLPVVIAVPSGVAAGFNFRF